MKTKKLNWMWCLVSITGLFLAICTMNESSNEIGLRAAGLVAFAVGAYLGGWMDLNDLNESDQNESNDLNELN